MHPHLGAILFQLSGSEANFPPYNLIRKDKDTHLIELAIAGFAREEVEITAEANLLVVKGRRAAGEGDYLHRGIAARDFERKFGLADYVEVAEANYRDGLLSIRLERRVPDHLKSRRIDIAS